MVEYALLAALISVACVASVKSFGIKAEEKLWIVEGGLGGSDSINTCSGGQDCGTTE